MKSPELSEMEIDESFGNIEGHIVHPSTGGFTGPKDLKSRIHQISAKQTKNLRLIPVNISSAFEFYLGIKKADDFLDSFIYGGDRL